MRQYHQKIGDPEKRPPELKNLREEYDFIVIGKEESIAGILRRQHVESKVGIQNSVDRIWGRAG